MITDIQIIANESLPAAVLRDFGKINVICGKNNSGKSTLLRAIDTPSMRLLGRKLDSSDADELCKSYCIGTVFLDGENYNPLGGDLSRIFNEVILSRDLWFADSSELEAEIAKRYASHHRLRQYSFNAGRIKNAARNHIAPEQPRTILIPPRRSVEEQSLIQMDAPVSSNGTGLLNHLFYCQSQSDGTHERELTQKLSSNFEEISNGFSFRIIPNKQNYLTLQFKSPGGHLVPANSCGQGLQDLMILLFFTISKDYDLLLVEEPESHLHPEIQRKLLAFFASEPTKQYVVTTHSNVFLDSAYVDRVFQTKYNQSITIEDQTTRAALLSELGYQVTDNLTSDAVILVEGPSDIPAIETFLIKLGAFPKYQIKFWPLGGDIMDKVDLGVFVERFKIFALIDHDPKSGPIRVRFESKCNDLGIPVCRLERYALENYFSLNAIREVFGGQVPPDLEVFKPMEPVSKQLGFDVKKRTQQLARRMDISELEGTDLLRFLNKVVDACKEPAYTLKTA